MAETKLRLFNTDELEEAVRVTHVIVCENVTADSDLEKSAQIEATGRIVAAMIMRGRI